LCTLHGYTLFSEEVCNEYAAQTMFFQSQAFSTEEKPDIVGLFFISKNAKGVQKSQNFTIWLLKSQIGNLA